MLTSCGAIGSAAADGVESRVRDKIGDALPEADRPAFVAKWATDKKEALAFAANSIGIEKLAGIIEGQNAELAAEVRAGGIETVKARWLAVAIAVAGTVASSIFGVKGGKWKGIAATVIGGVQGFLKAGPEGNRELMAHIKAEAITNSNKPAVDAAVGHVLAAKGEKPIVRGIAS